jgi:putative ABC transport system permease protein
LFVAQFVWFEYSFENFNKNADRTYRINLHNTSNGVFTGVSPGICSGLGYTAQQSIPGIESMARVSSTTTGIVSNKDQLEDREDDIVYADASIFKVLAIDLVEGDRHKILKDPNAIAISESTALKYFGDAHALGKVLLIGFSNGDTIKKPYQIEAVFRDIPANANEHFRFIFRPENQLEWNENWAWSNVHTYIVLSSGVSPESLNGGLSKIVNKYHKDNKGGGDRYLLEPIKEIRLQALDGSGRAALVNFFILLGAIILLLAWLNYINLSTARFFERMKEIGIRKLVGASRIQLVLQLLLESFLFNIISFCCAIILFFICWPLVSSFIGEPMHVNFFREQWVSPFIVISIIIGTLFSGFYPSLFLSSFKPLQSIKGKITNFTDRSALRKTLVMVQLSVSVILITAMIAVQRQIDFMHGQNIGISIEQTLMIDAPLLTDPTTVQKFEPFKNQILQLPTVKGVTYASSFPGTEIDWDRSDITLGQENADYKYSSRIVAIGTEFLDVFGLQLLAGRNFNSNNETDKKAMLINEEAGKMFGFANYDDALTKLIFVGSRKFEIIGVVKNYHFRSLQYQIKPLLFIQGYPRNPNYAIKTAPTHVSETISKIESIWKEAYAGNIFRYSFLDDSFEKQYANEKKIGAVVGGLAVLAIFISCSGLFAMSIYSVGRRTKEIGIRKVLGASVRSVIVLLSREYLKLVIISSVVVLPITYEGILLWLNGYAYQMPMNLWMFAFPFVFISLLTLISVSFQTVGAATKNPIESIKYE